MVTVRVVTVRAVNVRMVNVRVVNVRVANVRVVNVRVVNVLAGKCPDTELDEQLKSDNVFEFIEPDTYISMASDDYGEPLYFANVIEKNVAKDEIHDRFGHTIFTGQ